MTVDDRGVRELLCCGGKCGRPNDCWAGRERYTPSAKVAAVKAALAAARQEAFEEAAKWHEARAQECDAIAAVNGDNALGEHAKMHGADHLLYALDIRELARASTQEPTDG